ncbi:hypothetical protein [Bradyrhizobium lablabi]|uniref:hypothetical protein n=1 Tax=Bradyrhizobium lablabi TaxID=722472 RepID=UPI000AF943A0|nr:hypothetical protein [Bradyrhizobium lablabi]
MGQLQSFKSALSRRSLFGPLAGAAATFVVGVHFGRDPVVMSQSPGIDNAAMEFTIVNGWVLSRQDIAAEE